MSSTLNIIDLVDGNKWEGGADGYIVKAGQGQLEYNWRDLVALAEAEGKPWGLYWVCDSRYSPESQKAAIKKAFPTGDFGQLGLWLDVEKPRIDMTDADYRKTAYPYYKPIESIWRGVEAYTGVYPGWYFGPGSWDLICSAMPKVLQDEIAAECDAWIAHYGAVTPSMRGSWVSWVMWQWREGPDYNHVDQAWFEKMTNASISSEAYTIKRALADYEIVFTPGAGELPLLSAVEAAEKMGVEACMNGGAGFDYTDATHAIPKTAGFQTINGIPYARRLITNGVVNSDLDSTYQAPWCILGFDSTDVYLIVTRGMEGTDGKTQAQAAQYAKSLGIVDAYLMDSGRSAQIEQDGVMLYWPYSPDEKVPQFIGLKKKTSIKITIGGKMKGTAKGTVNIKNSLTGAIVHVMSVGEYLYGDYSTTKSDLIGFSHYYNASGEKIELGATCKASVANLTVTTETEPGDSTTPETTPVDASAIHVTLNDDRDGSVWKGDLNKQ